MAGVGDFLRTHPHGFDLQVGERGMSLSGGQRQSVAIARSLLLDPPIILLDEPTSHMDNSSEAAFKRRLDETLQGKTLFLVTHRSSLLSLIDRLLIIDNGKIVADVRLSHRGFTEFDVSEEAGQQEVLAAIEGHGGYVFATGGDGFAAAFGSVGEAVVAATTAQEGLHAEAWDDRARNSPRSISACRSPSARSRSATRSVMSPWAMPLSVTAMPSRARTMRFAETSMARKSTRFRVAVTAVSGGPRGSAAGFEK